MPTNLPRLELATVTQRSQLLEQFQAALQQQTALLYQQFEQGHDVEQLLKQHSYSLDQLLSHALLFFLPQPVDDLALIAVGGYGRQELFPHSDIDILILLSEETLAQQQNNIEQFIAFLWDTRLQIGHSVRTLQDCIHFAMEDVATATNLMEARLISGNNKLFIELQEALKSDTIWPSQAFFEAKREEQRARHKKYDHAEYRLEPNIKSSPGGLRDIQVISWICKRQFDVSDTRALLEHDIITAQEYDIISAGKAFLIKIRFALHMLNGREESRLSFEQQKIIASYFGFKDGERLAIEQLMQTYYRWAQTLSQLNDLIIQIFEENFYALQHQEVIEPLNERFQIRNKAIETRSDDTFLQHPSALIELFVLLEEDTELLGVRANTIRQLREHLYLIDDEFRQQAENQALFVSLLRSNRYIASRLNLMKRYGILGQYIPVFAQVMGQMQHDLYHIYTVDAHTIQVLKNARRLLYGSDFIDYPIVQEAINGIDKNDLLYLACLFHDIGKGRGGDHSLLGAVDADEFCQLHGYSQRECNLVRWLVEQHLLMSYTAQKKDLYDPDVIQEFALAVGDIERLNYLFVLTVADINGTNPSLWNSWRASLLATLYQETKFALLRGIDNIADKQELIEEKQQQALALLKDIHANIDFIQRLWHSIGDAYFLSESVADIVWQSKAISEQKADSQTLVLIQQSSNPRHHGATQIFIHTPDRPYLFAHIVSVLGHLQLNIVDANIYSSVSGYTLDTFLVLDETSEEVLQPQRLQYIQQRLEYFLSRPEKIKQLNSRYTTQRLKHIQFPTRTRISQNEKAGVTVLELLAADRPGLLATIGSIFVEFEINLNNAKISTQGDRVEDIFFITDQQGKPLNDDALCEALQSTIQQRLDQQLESLT